MNYDELPKRNKETSDGEKAINCQCGGRIYMAYLEREIYMPICEKCGYQKKFKANSVDRAIQYWNELRVQQKLGIKKNDEYENCHKCAFVANCPNPSTPERCYFNKFTIPLAEIGKALEKAFEEDFRLTKVVCGTLYTFESVKSLLYWYEKKLYEDNLLDFEFNSGVKPKKE